jgi:hypothetical protein
LLSLIDFAIFSHAVSQHASWRCLVIILTIFHMRLKFFWYLNADMEPRLSCHSTNAIDFWSRTFKMSVVNHYFLLRFCIFVNRSMMFGFFFYLW